MKLLACFALFLWGAGNFRSDAFTPLARSPKAASCRLAQLWATSLDTKASEKRLRQEIVQRNSLVEREEQYSVLDGERLTAGLEVEKVPVPSLNAEAAATMTDGKSLSSELERLTRTRPYPLFLAEKAVELVESTVNDLQKAFQSLSVDDASTTTTGSRLREKVVILGTGWGAVSYLKAIDTDLYDVTVISPRNYFLFTPMLAGACVGTVEYRSITQPVREVNQIVASGDRDWRH
jgi:hypothetical protein